MRGGLKSGFMVTSAYIIRRKKMQKISCYSIEVRVQNVANKIRTSINASYEKGSKFYVRSTVEFV